MHVLEKSTIRRLNVLAVAKLQPERVIQFLLAPGAVRASAYVRGLRTTVSPGSSQLLALGGFSNEVEKRLQPCSHSVHEDHPVVPPAARCQDQEMLDTTL